MECSRCKHDLPANQFRKHSRRCHKCLAEVAKEYRVKNYEKHLACLRKSYRKFRKERREYAAKYYKERGIYRSAEARLQNALWKKQNPEKVHAKSVVERAVKSGKLKRPDCCSQCGKEGWIVGHHHDYTKPLDVIWVCQTCHRDIHLGNLAIALE